MSIEIASAA